MKRKLQPIFISFVLLIVIASLLSGCKRSDSSKNAPPTAAASPKKPQTVFESDLDYVRKGSFIYVFVFSRKEGGAFTKDDITYLKANSPAETNQWILTEEGRKVIAGTNFEFKPEHFDALNQRFNVEDYSNK